MATRRRSATAAKKAPAKKATKKAAKKAPAKKATRGRPPIQGKRMSAGIFVRCSQEQREAIEAFVADLSEKRKAKGLPGVELSTWVREVALKYSGNENLGAAAEARRKAAAAASIV